jgi:hypothetical protein
MDRSGRLEVLNVVRMEFVDGGRSLRFETIASLPPHATSLVLFKNVYSIKLSMTGQDEYPLVLVDLAWRDVRKDETQRLFRDHDYAINDEMGNPLVRDRRLTLAQLEGDIVGEILADQVEVTSDMGCGP